MRLLKQTIFIWWPFLTKILLYLLKTIIKLSNVVLSFDRQRSSVWTIWRTHLVESWKQMWACHLWILLRPCAQSAEGIPTGRSAVRMSSALSNTAPGGEAGLSACPRLHHPLHKTLYARLDSSILRLVFTENGWIMKLRNICFFPS